MFGTKDMPGYCKVEKRSFMVKIYATLPYCGSMIRRYLGEPLE